jgi:hypothetical protein
MLVRRFIAIVAVALIGLFGVLILARGSGRSQGAEDVTRAQHKRFDVRDRENVGEWYKGHQGNLPPGFQAEDRLSPSSEAKLRIGEIMNPELRPMVRPAPVDLLRKLPPAATGYRYEILNGHLLLLEDRTWNVSDVLHFELDFGPLTASTR